MKVRWPPAADRHGVYRRLTLSARALRTLTRCSRGLAVNDFVALLLAVVAFCLAFLTIGASVRLAVAMDLAPHGLAPGSLVQFALAGAAGHRAWRRVRPKVGNPELHA